MRSSAPRRQPRTRRRPTEGRRKGAASQLSATATTLVRLKSTAAGRGPSLERRSVRAVASITGGAPDATVLSDTATGGADGAAAWCIGRSMTDSGSGLRMLALAIVVAIGCCSPTPSIAIAADSPKPQVICLTEWGYQPEGDYRTRPVACDLHDYGAYPVAHVNVWVTKRLRWSSWGPKSAVATGKLGISTYGLAPLKLRLTRPRELCGHVVFTRAHLDVRVRYDGKVRRSGHWTWLDKCLSSSGQLSRFSALSDLRPGEDQPLTAVPRQCRPVVNPYPGTRYAGVNLRQIRSIGVQCPIARRVARKAHYVALGLPVPASGVRRFRWHGWSVIGDLRTASDSYVARRDGKRITWQF
jgi:hypothetical protein